MVEVLGTTNVVGIVGWPVSHSLSPLMQNAAFAALSLDYIYVPFAVRPEGLAAAVAGLRELNVVGFNVTIPHKTAIVPLLDRLSEEAEAAGSVNTVKRQGDMLVGYNTDGTGLIASLRGDLNFVPRGRNIVVLGAGGAARSALVSLCAAGARSVAIVNRSLERAAELARKLREAFSGIEIAEFDFISSGLRECLGKADLLINSTSVGMGGTSFDSIDPSWLNAKAKVYDMVYNPPETSLLASIRAAGLVGANGVGMLVSQGEAAFTIWTGLQHPSGVMRAVVTRHLMQKY